MSKSKKNKKSIHCAVRIVPQREGGKIFRYLIYAWTGHPLLGRRIMEGYANTEKEAKKIAKEMKKMCGY